MDPWTQLGTNFLLLLFAISMLVFMVWPALVFFAVIRLLRDLRAIRQAIEHAAYERDRAPRAAAAAIAPAVTPRAGEISAHVPTGEAPGPPRVTLSAFGR